MTGESNQHTPKDTGTCSAIYLGGGKEQKSDNLNKVTDSLDNMWIYATVFGC